MRAEARVRSLQRACAQLRAVLIRAWPARCCRRDEFIAQLESLEDRMKCVAPALWRIHMRLRRFAAPPLRRLTARALRRSTAHQELEVVLQRYADPASKAARKLEGAAVEQLSLKLEQTQDKIDAVRTRGACVRARPVAALSACRAASAGQAPQAVHADCACGGCAGQGKARRCLTEAKTDDCACNQRRRGALTIPSFGLSFA